MIDDPAQVIDLMAKLEAQVPIPVTPTSDLVRTLRSKGLKLATDRVIFIKRVFYMGDEGGISCDVTPSRDTKEAFVVSLTHLRVVPTHPLARDIRAYQRARVSRLTG
jgi:hypothetical protein